MRHASKHTKDVAMEPISDDHLATVEDLAPPSHSPCGPLIEIGRRLGALGHPVGPFHSWRWSVADLMIIASQPQDLRSVAGCAARHRGGQTHIGAEEDRHLEVLPRQPKTLPVPNQESKAAVPIDRCPGSLQAGAIQKANRLG